jgi:hypothetical protein
MTRADEIKIQTVSAGLKDMGTLRNTVSLYDRGEMLRIDYVRGKISGIGLSEAGN